MWDANKLELVMEVKKAHEGQRIQCAAVAPDGCLYTGGDDKVSTHNSKGRGDAEGGGGVSGEGVHTYVYVSLGSNAMSCKYFLVTTQLTAVSAELWPVGCVMQTPFSLKINAFFSQDQRLS